MKCWMRDWKAEIGILFSLVMESSGVHIVTRNPTTHLASTVYVAINLTNKISRIYRLIKITTLSKGMVHTIIRLLIRLSITAPSGAIILCLGLTNALLILPLSAVIKTMIASTVKTRVSLIYLICWRAVPFIFDVVDIEMSICFIQNSLDLF